MTWRNGPPTPKQRKLIGELQRELNIDGEIPDTAGGAHLLINTLIRRRRIREGAE